MKQKTFAYRSMLYCLDRATRHDRDNNQKLVDFEINRAAIWERVYLKLSTNRLTPTPNTEDYTGFMIPKGKTSD